MLNTSTVTNKKIIFNYLDRFSVIPLQKNSKQPACSWKDYQTRKMTTDEVEKLTWNNIAIITGAISNLIVVDADTKETIEFLEQFEEFRETAKVETKRGRHYYFLIEDIPQDYNTQKIYKKNIKIDVKANGGYVVAPPSQIDGHVYTWIGNHNGSGGIEEALNLKFSEFVELLEHIKSKLFKKKEKKSDDRSDETDEGGTDKVKWKKLKELILRRYEEGRRQDIILYLGGWLKKLGERREKIEELVADICLEAGDRDVLQRLSAVKNTFKNSDVKGISGLVELGYSQEELEEVVGGRKEPQERETIYTELDGIVYALKNGTPKMLGPAVTISAVVHDEKYKAYEIRYNNESEIMKDIADLSAIQKLTGIAVVKEKDFLEYLNLQAIKCDTHRFIRRTTGWRDGIFYHPAIQPEDIWDFWAFSSKVNPVEYEKDKQHMLIREALKIGGKLAFTYAFCLASVLNDLLRTNPSVMFISGPARAGKTTLAQLAVNLFLPSEQVFATAYSTHTGFELMMRQLKGLPILFDECVLKEMELEKIVFMVASRVGKIRGTKNLSINISEMNSNVIFTSEVLEQTHFKRAGSYRRLVAITMEDFQKDCFLGLPVEEIQKWKKYYGAGIDIISFLMRDPEGWRQHEEKVENDIEEAKLHSLYHVTKPVLMAIKVFEDFYKEKFPKTYEEALSALVEQKNEFESRIDWITKFREDFSQFLVRKSSQIVDPHDPQKRIAHDVIGQREEGGFYILTSAFNEFCIEYGYEQRILIRELVRNNIISPYSHGKNRKIKKINGVAVSTYHIVLDVEEEKSIPRIDREPGNG